MEALAGAARYSLQQLLWIVTGSSAVVADCCLTLLLVPKNKTTKQLTGIPTSLSPKHLPTVSPQPCAPFCPLAEIYWREGAKTWT
jgi:hypothetical protein